MFELVYVHYVYFPFACVTIDVKMQTQHVAAMLP